MTWLANRMKDRIQIRKPIQTPNVTTGGFDRSYTTLLTIWSNVKPIKFGSFLIGAYVRGKQVRNFPTHIIEIRRNSVQNLGRAFTVGFSTGFNSIADLTPLKSDYFIFFQKSSTVKGKLFRVHRIEDHEERRELLKLICGEIEEQGTGYQS